MTITETYLAFQIGSDSHFSDSQKQTLVRELAKPPEANEKGLSGRIRPHIAEIEGIGRVIVKHYFRGGVLRHVNQRTYLKTGKTRSEAEFETLSRVRGLGVSAPEPVAFASRPRGFIFYHAWLFTKEIPGAETIADLSQADSPRVARLLPEVEKQVTTLMENGIVHVDFHPGNVLVDGSDRIYIIDFDRSRTDNKNASGLAGFYASRWQRAIAKHGLPTFLNNLNLR